MEVKKVKISELVHAEYNPRQMTEQEVADLKASIKKFGLVDPVIVNQHPSRKNIIVGGNQRVRIAKEMGMSEIDAVFVNLDPAKEKELCLRLNKNTGEWNWDKLANEFDDELLSEVGFKDLFKGIHDIMGSPDKNSDGKVEDLEGIQGELTAERRPVIFWCENQKDYDYLSSIFGTNRKYNYDIVKLLNLCKKYERELLQQPKSNK